MADLSFNQQLAITLIDKAIIGGLLVFAVYKFNRFLETYKNQSAKSEEAERTKRQALADLSKRIAAGSHIICWLCWYAKYSPTEVTLISFENYEKEMHATQTELVGLRVVLAAVDKERHSRLSHYIDRLYKMDVEVGKSKTLFLQSRDKGLKALSEIHEKSLSFDRELLTEITR